MSKAEEIEKRRAERRLAANEGRAKQIEIDLEAIDKLEAEGGECLHTLDANGYKAGVPVRVAYRPASGAQYKRFCDQVARAQEKNRGEVVRKAQDMLAESCWVYPADKSVRDSVLEAFPGTLISIAIEVAKLAELSREEEGKG